MHYSVEKRNAKLNQKKKGYIKNRPPGPENPEGLT